MFEEDTFCLLAMLMATLQQNTLGLLFASLGPAYQLGRTLLMKAAGPDTTPASTSLWPAP